mmetsp:Transcript_7878/g.11687  ORF Transcript_7878/g.11687 Transcript_7878/m.11687 type:complete len:560 (-) Transcript_7878:57-1736(-)
MKELSVISEECQRIQINFDRELKDIVSINSQNISVAEELLQRYVFYIIKMIRQEFSDLEQEHIRFIVHWMIKKKEEIGETEIANIVKKEKYTIGDVVELITLTPTFYAFLEEDMIPILEELSREIKDQSDMMQYDTMSEESSSTLNNSDPNRPTTAQWIEQLEVDTVESDFMSELSTDDGDDEMATKYDKIFQNIKEYALCINKLRKITVLVLVTDGQEFIHATIKLRHLINKCMIIYNNITINPCKYVLSSLIMNCTLALRDYKSFLLHLIDLYNNELTMPPTTINGKIMYSIKKVHAFYLLKYRNIQSLVGGCEHYERGCELKCHKCDKFYACRRCHDDNVLLDHEFDRYAVREIRCKKCLTIQSPRKKCSNCNIEFASYYCKPCNFYLHPELDLEAKQSVYHCEKCNLCRRGKQEDHFHCDSCHMDFLKIYYEKHIISCLKNSSHNNCPICFGDIHSSVTCIVDMRCGHKIHGNCLKEAQRNKMFRCPICSKVMVDHDVFNQIIQRQIDIQPMPEEFANQKSTVLCNECLNYSEVPFHFIAMKCGNCGSFNTKKAK